MRRGFSLVELLVVIGIIAMLTAILLPTLNRGRQNAMRASCMSNLRQMHHTLSFYARDHRDRVPVGYRRAKQFNSMIWSHTAGRFVLFGLLYDSRVVPSHRAFYCPAETNPRFMYATDENPWPPGPAGDPTRPTQAGYGFRPEIDIPDDLSSHAGFVMPRLRDFRNKAIVADLANSATRLSTRHQRSLGVLYADASVQHLESTPILPLLSGVPEPAGVPMPQWDSRMEQVWLQLDRGRR